MTTFSDVALLIYKNCFDAQSLNLFAFGSKMNGGVGEDYDILLIEDDILIIDLFRQELMELTYNLPVHLTVLTLAEITETAFLRKTRAVPLLSLL